MDHARETVLATFNTMKPGTLLFVDYVAAGQRDAAASALAAASAAAGLAPTHYIGEFVKVEVVHGDPVFTLRVHNRNRELRRFNSFKGTLRAIRVLAPPAPMAA